MARGAEYRDRPAKRSPVDGPEEDVSPPPPPWVEVRTRRPRRPARPPLDRDQIVAAGLRIVDVEGVDALSLRRLASDLHVAPMSLYWHVHDKAELLDLLGGAVLASIDIPPPTGDWIEQLRGVHRAIFVAFMRHPNTADLMIGRARYGPAGLRLFERILAIALEAGLSPTAAFDAYQSLYLFTLGFAATASRSPEFVAVQREGLAYLLTLPGSQFPAIRRVAPVIGGRSFEEQFELGLDVVLAGIAERLRPKRSR